MKITINTYTAIKLMILSVFVFGYTIRVSTIPTFQYVSVLFLLGMCILLKKHHRNISIKKTFLWIVFFASTVLSDAINNVSLHQWQLYFFMNTVSLLVFMVDNNSLSLEKNEIKKLIRTYNKFVYLIFIIYLVDLLTGSLIMRTLADNWLTCIANWVPRGKSLFTSRYASYLGHYLFTDVIYVGYYILNAFYKQSFFDETEKPIILHIVAVIGVISTGSKTGLLILSVLLIMFNIKKIKYMIALIVGAFALYFAGFFNILLGRLSTEEFSTGRFGAWQTLFSMKVMKFNLFYGIGDDFFEYIHRFVDFGTAGIATEFPILCLLFKVGVIGFIAYIALMLLIPGYELLRKKNLYGAGCIGAYFFLIATYNGLTAYPDTQIVYIIVVLLIELISKVAKKKYTLNEWKVEIE